MAYQEDIGIRVAVEIPNADIMYFRNIEILGAGRECTISVIQPELRGAYIVGHENIIISIQINVCNGYAKRSRIAQSLHALGENDARGVDVRAWH
jgi:hypothetical protein